MSDVELSAFAILLVGAFTVTSAYSIYCCARFQMQRKGLKTLIPIGVLVAWLVISVIVVVAIYVLLMAHSQRDTVLMMLRTIGVGYPILGIGFVLVLRALNKSSNPATASRKNHVPPNRS